MRAAAALLLLLAACRQDMHDQPRFEPLEGTTLFPDGRSARPQVPGTVARGQLRLDTHLYEGKVDGELAKTFPFPVTPEVLARGQERYLIHCSPCHDRVGYGQGIVVKRGMKAAASYHVPRLREAPPGHFFDVMTRGFGAMYDFAHVLKPEDRWAIAAYIRVLQRSQGATLDDVPTAVRERLEAER